MVRACTTFEDTEAVTQECASSVIASDYHSTAVYRLMDCKGVVAHKDRLGSIRSGKQRVSRRIIPYSLQHR